jgi:uncharacterized membrane protein
MSVSFAMRSGRADAVHPTIRRITITDLKSALRDGFDDFRQVPTQLAFVCVIYPVVAIVAAKMMAGYRVLPLFYPMAAGFALVGPLAAIGMYEISRRRERGDDVSWQDAFAVLRSRALPHIVQMAVVLLIIFGLWMAAAKIIYASMFDEDSAGTISDLLTQVFTTGSGLLLILLGNFVGLLFAAVALSVSIVSFPMILDRNVDVATAIRTSLQAAAHNPVPVLVWGLIVAVALLLGSLPFFVGLAVVMPILGHATWHLYRRLVDPGPSAPAKRP